jgi:hypothetical protein
MRRGAGPNKSKFAPKSGAAKGRSGTSPAKGNAKNNKSSASSKKGVADKAEKRKPQSQLDVYEDSSDGEGNAAFYSHIDEGARPDMEGMDAAARRRFKSTMINAEEDDDEDGDVFEDDEEIDEDEAFDEEDEKRYGEVLSGIGQRGKEAAKGKAGKGKDKKKAKKHQVRRIFISTQIKTLADFACFVDNQLINAMCCRKSHFLRAMTPARSTRTTVTTTRPMVPLRVLFSASLSASRHSCTHTDFLCWLVPLYADFEGDENEGDFKRLDEMFDELDENEDDEEEARNPPLHADLDPRLSGH